MALSQDASARVEALRFPLIVGIVLLHAYGTAMRFSQGAIGATDISPVAIWFQNIVSQVVARSVVPMFFLISGLLYFATYTPSAACIKQKLANRTRTLLVPYLCWNTAVLLVYAILQTIPATASYFATDDKAIERWGAFDFVNAFVGFGKGPVADQFWFVRDLFLVVLAAPLFAWMAKRLPPLASCVAAVLAWMTFREVKLFNLLSITSIAYFYIGAVIALRGWTLGWIDRYRRPLLLGYLALAVCDAIWMGRFVPDGPELKQWRHSYLNQSLLVVGMFCAWALAGWSIRRPAVKVWLDRLAPLAFFVFAAHEPLLGGLKKILYKLIVPQTSWEVIAVYVIAPVAAITVTLAVGNWLRTHYPAVFAVLCGSREAGRTPMTPTAMASQRSLSSAR